MSDVKVATTKEQRLALLEKVGQSLLKMPYKSWNFGDSTGFEGVLVTGKLLKDPKYFSFAISAIRKNKMAWTFLLFDVLLGLVSFLIYHFSNGDFGKIIL